MSAHANVTEHLRSLRLPDAKAEYMAQLADASYDSLGFSERLDLVLTAELAARRTRRVQRRLKEANLRVNAHKEEFYFDAERGITRSELAELASLSFMASGRGVIISGATGCGKTYLACILGTEAATRELTVRYHRTSELIERLAMARAEGNSSAHGFLPARRIHMVNHQKPVANTRAMTATATGPRWWRTVAPPDDTTKISATRVASHTSRRPVSRIPLGSRSKTDSYRPWMAVAAATPPRTKRT